jgi:gluconolactonase
MKTLLCWAMGFALTLLVVNTEAQTNNSTLFFQQNLKLVSDQFAFTEGCSTDKSGNVFFSDQPNDKVWKYSTDGKLSIFLEKTGRTNGTYFDKKGNLILCADEKGEVWLADKIGITKVVAKGYQGKQLNGPNDVWIDPSGNMFLTDPYYQRDYWTRTSPSLSSQNVYILRKGASEVAIAADSLNQPNGIVGTPDGKYLYVADAGAGKIFRYDIGQNGALHNKKLFINRGSDGMTLDEKGNVYLTGNGITIYNTSGNQIAQINVPEGTSNLCFAGKDKNILFITAKKSIYTIPMNIRGVE